jgi:hypothetical protein
MGSAGLFLESSQPDNCYLISDILMLQHQENLPSEVSFLCTPG